MEQSIKAQVVKEVAVVISVWVNNRQYQFMVPSGVSYDEAYTVALEMGGIIKQMQQENRQAEQQEPAQQHSSDQLQPEADKESNVQK